MPLSALFILFDFVIHNPSHSETERNIALLDQVAVHFGDLDYSSAGALPGGIIARFAGIARQYIFNLGYTPDNGAAPESQPEMPRGIEPVWHWTPDIDFSDIPVGKLSVESILWLMQQQFPLMDSSAQQMSYNADFGMPLGETLYYPPFQDAQTSADRQLEELRAIFGGVFPDWTGDVQAAL